MASYRRELASVVRLATGNPARYDGGDLDLVSGRPFCWLELRERKILKPAESA